MRKARPDAVLKMLPPEEQEELFEFLKNHSCPQAVEWLAERGTRTQRYSVREFFHWYSVSRQVTGAVAALQTLSEQVAEHPELLAASEPAAAAAQAILELQALQAGDVKQHVALARVRQGAQRVDLERCRLREKREVLRLKIIQFREQRNLARRRAALQARAEQRADRRFQRENCALVARWQSDEKRGKGRESDETFTEKLDALGRAVFGGMYEEEKQKRKGEGAARQDPAPVEVPGHDRTEGTGSPAAAGRE